MVQLFKKERNIMCSKLAEVLLKEDNKLSQISTIDNSK